MTTRVGVEVDGTTAVAATVTDDRVVSVNVVSSDTPEKALAQILAGVKRNVPVRVALVTPGAAVRRVDVSPAMLDRRQFETAVYAAVRASTEGTTAAAVFHDLDALTAGGMCPGTAVVAPAEEVNLAYGASRRHRLEVVTPAFTFAGAGLDGLHLGLRRSVTDLTLVSQGKVVAHRQIRDASIGDLATRLGGVDVAMRVLLTEHLAATDLIHDDERGRWLRTLAQEVRRSLDQWSKTAVVTAETVHVYGPAGDAPLLPGYLSDVGLTTAVPDVVRQALSQLPGPGARSAVGAWLAARSLGEQLPQAVFPDPHVAQVIAAQQTSSRRTKLIAGGAAAVVALTALWLVPPMLGQRELDAAQARKTAATARLAALAEQSAQMTADQARAAAADAGYAQRLRWSALLGQVWATAPAGATLSSVTPAYSQQTQMVTVTVSANFRGTVDDLSAWTQRLRTDLQALDAWPRSFSVERDRLNASLSFTIPAARLALTQETPR
jgi:hypothetical protein